MSSSKIDSHFKKAFIGNKMNWEDCLAKHLNRLSRFQSKEEAMSAFNDQKSKGTYENCCSVSCLRVRDQCELFWLLPCQNHIVIIDEDDSRPALSIDWLNCLSFIRAYCDRPPEITLHKMS